MQATSSAPGTTSVLQLVAVAHEPPLRFVHVSVHFGVVAVCGAAPGDTCGSAPAHAAGTTIDPEATTNPTRTPLLRRGDLVIFILLFLPDMPVLGSVR